MKRKLLIGSIISGFFLYLALRGVQWDVLLEVLKEARLSYILPAVVAGLAGFYFRAYRWKFMLLAIKPIPTSRLFSVTMIGLMANNLLPARLGEIVRAHVIGHGERISRTASFATIVYERIVDVFSLLVLLWLVLTRIPGPPWLSRSAMWLLVGNVLLMIAMLAMERYRGVVTRLVSGISGRFSQNVRVKIDHATAGFLGGLAGMVQVRTFLPIALTSVPALAFPVLTIHLCLGALDIQVPVVASATLVVLIAIASMIPSAPAYLGTTQYASVVGLGFFGVGKTEALAFSMLFHALQFFPITALGLYFLWRSEISLREISKTGEEGTLSGATRPPDHRL
jgi:uncharacterized protein (TIRG00374 family)